ncbi:hypothetical protein M758_UG173300 [Ceratodon purpureus]|nr:hypothetical protein M758_UG173300 [Ceratodon purpureus]
MEKPSRSSKSLREFRCDALAAVAKMLRRTPPPLPPSLLLSLLLLAIACRASSDTLCTAPDSKQPWTPSRACVFQHHANFSASRHPTATRH